MPTKHLAWMAMLGLASLVAHASAAAQPSERYTMRGMVLKIAPSHKSFIVSHDSLPGVMDAMTMSFDVGEPKELDGVAPDFTLTDQARRSVTLSSLRGKVVAINFIYTSCALPQFCFRIANNFGVVQKRFRERMGQDLILLTVTFDPVRDQPERLAEYASQWNADPRSWHFLTGTVADVRPVCDRFGVDFFPDEGLINHSSHTALIDRHGDLVANIEGNEFTATQLGDLVEATLKRSVGQP